MKKTHTTTHSSSCAFYDNEVISALRNKKKLAAFINSMIYAETGRLSALNYIFVSDKFLLKMNKDFLQHDTYTDIITFDLSEKNSNEIQGEIYISVERVKENAKEFFTTYQKELHRVIFHGALHLCGYKDKSKSQSAKMRKKEGEWMEEYFLTPKKETATIK